jgi:hypothetical protein
MYAIEFSLLTLVCVVCIFIIYLAQGGTLVHDFFSGISMTPSMHNMAPMAAINNLMHAKASASPYIAPRQSKMPAIM